MKMTQEELNKVLAKHKKWLNDEEDGERANLRSADLRSANLSSADLSYADLSYADLSSADLRSADLSYADLSYADLRYANLRYADLSYANLRYADLQQSQGVPYSQCSFSGHGECGRLLTLAIIKDEQRFFCGCFSGTPGELAEYIKNGDKEYKESRTLAMNFCLDAIKF